MRYRLASPADLATFRDMLHPGFRMPERVRERLLPLWTDLLISSDRCVVIEDPSRPHPSCIEGVGASVFISDAFVEENVTRPQLHIAAILYDQILSGRSAVLSQREVAEANAGAGLNLLALPFGLRNHDFADERTHRVLQCASAAFYFLHAGYRLKLIVQEVYGNQQAAYMEAGGFRLVSDFSDYDGPLPDDRISADRPFLYALRKEWVAQGAVNPMSFLFHAPRPTLGLSPTQQRVLFKALSNASDEEIGRSMGISLDAVKKTWRRAFDRVAEAAPYVLGAKDAAVKVGRGAEKRRFLLEYLRLHLEELRPYKPVSNSIARTPDPGRG